MQNPKLKKVIENLEMLRQKYIEKYGKEPVVWLMTEDDGKTTIELCSGVTREGFLTKSHGGAMKARMPMAMM
jgi:hypothetical protein